MLKPMSPKFLSGLIPWDNDHRVASGGGVGRKPWEVQWRAAGHCQTQQVLGCERSPLWSGHKTCLAPHPQAPMQWGVASQEPLTHSPVPLPFPSTRCHLYSKANPK